MNKPASHYTEAAEAFLSRNGIACRISLSDSKEAAWQPSGHHYRVTLSGKRRRITFDFWGSQHDMQHGLAPTAYDVLACISGDAHTPDTFEDFCGDYGYDADSIKAKQAFTRRNRFAKRLRAFFSPEEIEQLSEIQ